MNLHREQRTGYGDKPWPTLLAFYLSPSTIVHIISQRAVFLVRGAMECLLLTVVVLSPWAYGCVPKAFLFLLLCAVAGLLWLWALATALDGCLTWRSSRVAFGIAALFLLSIWQSAPLPEEWVTSLSPGTTALRRQLSPEDPQLITSSSVISGQSTLSLYPDATRREAINWLAVFVVFVFCLNNTSSTAQLHRLSVVVLVNGALLSLFAIVQFFTAPRDSVYWVYPTLGTVFGPFVCRNNFACYTNMCLGLGLGLFLKVRSSLAGDSARGGPLWFLNHPRLLWLGTALTLIAAGVCLSLSRGGVLSLFAALAIGLVLLSRSESRLPTRGYALAVAIGLGFVIAFCVGGGPIEERLSATLSHDTLQRGRLDLWERTLPLVRDFPVWGSGLGTFQYIEPMTRRYAHDADIFYENAHNEYLEAAIEGGFVRASVSVLTVLGVVWLGVRALLRPASAAQGSLTLGALIAFMSLAFHSFCDFGIHLPAIAMLGTLIAAHLCVQGSVKEETHTLNFWGLAPAASALSALGLGFILVSQGWREQRIERLRVSAQQFAGRPEALEHLEAVTRLAPDDAIGHHDLGRAIRELYYREIADIDRKTQVVQAVESVLAAGSLLTGAPRHPALLPLPIEVALSWPRPLSLQEAFERAGRDHLVPGLLHELRARAACPLLAEPHLALAAHVDMLPGSSTHEHLDRARLMWPGNPSMWFTCGLIEMGSGYSDEAARSWGKSLELAPLFHKQILGSCVGRFSPQDIAERVLPADASLLARSATLLFPRPEDLDRRRAVLERARKILEQHSVPLAAADCYLLGEIQWQLGDFDAALPPLQEAVRGKPLDPAGHYLLARVYYEKEQFRDARAELMIVLTLQPSNSDARELLRVVTHRMTVSVR